MNCGDVKELFSPYLDGQVSGVEMHALSRHMKECPRCTREYAALQRTQQLLAGLGPKKAPADLALKLRVAISQQVAQARRARYEGLQVRMENALNAFMVPATAGLVSAVLIFTTFRPALSMGRPTSGRAVISFSKISVKG